MLKTKKRQERLTRLKRYMTTMSTVGCAALMVNANADLATYSQDFEAMDPLNEEALSADGWQVFGNVFDPSGSVFLYGYGAFPAPNGSGAFSNVGTGEGGPNEGANQLVIFNDYNNADHNNGFLIESNVFQEQTIGAADIGTTWSFSFNAKKGDTVAPSTATAFIKTLDPENGFATTNLIDIDTETLPTTWDRYTLSIDLTDPLLEGQLLQFGFNSTAANFTASGMVYDNVEFRDPNAAVDTDNDGVDDTADNCTLVSNADQRDTNGDGFGNACDPDFNNDGIVNFIDISGWVPFFNTACGDVDQDLSGDGFCNFADFSVIPSYFGMPPGPSGVAP